MAVDIASYQLIETESDLVQFYETNKEAKWLGFDSEFVGEKRFFTQLCLIQVSSDFGNYLIDPILIEDITPFLKLVEDPNIIKITHAGENDYRLLHIGYDIQPKNIFDTQIAAGFVGYKYPISFRKLVESELNVPLSKAYAVTDWESRPMEKRQLKYAINDVLPLYDLWQLLTKKLNDAGRLAWAEEEFKKLENADFYEKDPHHEALNSNLMRSLRRRDKVFLIRLYAWRREMAKQKNYSKEMVLPQKLISHIARSVNSGREALKHNRRIPKKIVNDYGQIFEDMYQVPISPEEKALLDRIPREEQEDPRAEIVLEMIYLLIKHKCLEEDVSSNLVIQKSTLKRLRGHSEKVEEEIGEQWKSIFLGPEIMNWLGNIDRLKIEMNENGATLRME
jgi:ribonuclease D